MKRMLRAAFAVSAALVLGAGPAAAESLSGSYLAGRHAARTSDVAAAAQYFASALRRDPDNLGLMEQAVIYKTAAGDIETAVNLAKRLAAARADHRMAALVLTAAELRAGALDAASARMKASPDAFHPLVGAMLRAWTKHGLGDDAGAGEALGALEDRAIFRIFTGYHEGLMAHAGGDASAAVAAYERAAAEMNAPTGRIARAYAAALRATGDEEKARTIYDGALAVAVGDAVLEAEIAALEASAPATPIVSTPADGAAEALYGLAAALGRDTEERLSLVYARLALYLRPDFDEAALLTAELLEDQEQYALAVAAYENIGAESPLWRSAEIGRAEALRKMGEEEQAIEALKALVRRAPDAIDAHIALGDMLRRTERFAEGAVAYEQAIDLMAAAGRPSWVLFYERGICLERSGEWDRAEADFRRALEMQTDQPLVLNYLGYSLLEMGRDIDEAMAMIRKAVAQRPEDGYIVDSLGWGHYLLGEYEDAVRELERAIELRPVDPVINDHLGDALWQVGRRLEADFQWRRALSFDPEEDDAVRIRRKLREGLDAVLRDEEGGADKPAETANDG